jgi:hypothetical protein
MWQTEQYDIKLFYKRTFLLLKIEMLYRQENNTRNCVVIHGQNGAKSGDKFL